MESNKQNNIQFLTGGGEMGKLTREKDWSKTVLGSPSCWPQSLRTALSIILNSKFPMFLFWGEDLVCFYNDAYRPSLGNEGKHPSILGMNAQDAWAEIWHIIKPLIDKVLTTGEATWSEDQLIPIYRNGKIEDVYWTFSYSPVNDESGKRTGVFITCTETTEKINTAKNLRESEERFRMLADNIPNLAWMAKEDGWLYWYNKRWYEYTGTNPDQMEGWGWQTVHDAEKLPLVMKNWTHAISKGEIFEMVFPLKGADSQFRQFLTRVLPLKDSNGKIYQWLGTNTDISQQKQTEAQLEHSKNELEFAIDASELGTWDYNPLTNKFSSNSRLKEWFGLAPDEELDLAHAVNSIIKADVERVTEAIQKALDFSSRSNYDIEYTITHPVTKKEKIVHAKGKAWFNEDKIAYRFNGTLEDVTEKTIAYKKIEETRERYQNLIYSSPSAIGILHGEDLIITIANDAIINIWGKGKDIIGKAYFDALPELAEQGYKEIFAEVYKTGIPFNAVETPVSIFQDREMQRKYYNFLIYPQKNLNGETDGIAIIATDVTLQALLNNKIKENEKRFRLLADSMPQFIWTSDREGNLNYYNQSVFDYSGLDIEQINKDGWLQIIHPDDREKNIQEWKKAIETGNNFLLEHRFKKHTGEYRWQLSRAIPQKDDKGEIQTWVGTSTDIDEQKTFAEELEKKVAERTKELIRSNQSLKKSELRYHLMVEEVQDYAILFLNREGFIENWNSGAEKIKGYKAHEIIGKSFSNFYTEEDRKNNLPQKLLAHSAETGKAAHEGWRVRKDGSLFWASVVITAVHDEQKNVIGFSKVTHDLTEKKNADDKLRKNAAQLEQKNIDLERMNKDLQSFAYISSHDLQEPLRKIQTFSSWILEKERENLSESGKEYFRRMQDAALRMQTLIDDLLAYSRTNSEDRKFEKIDLNKMITQVKDDLKEELQQKQAIIETGELCEVNIIPFQFRQLLHNLIVNSLKFSNPQKPIVIKIKSKLGKGEEFSNKKLADNKDYCRISISDNGIGFDQKFSEKIFELFQRLHGKQEYKGTGIGLSIVKRIVENHGGIIEAEGKLNEGATFDMYFPA